MDKMKKIGFQISLLMGVAMSLCLSFTGLFCSGKFTLMGFVTSFGESFVISMIIGLLVPMKKVNDKMGEKLHLQPGALKTRLLETLVSDLIYTPVITLVMTFSAYKTATAHGARMKYLPMFGESLIISLLVAFCVIYLVTPLIFRFVMSQNGISGPPQGMPPQNKPEQE